MPNDDPRKMEEIRRFSAIYGRFDCKRKPEKPLTLHEVGLTSSLSILLHLPLIRCLWGFHSYIQRKENHNFKTLLLPHG